MPIKRRIIKFEAKKYQKELELEIAIKGLHDKDLTEEKYFKEGERIVKCNVEVNTEEVIGEKEIIVSNTNPSNRHASVAFYSSLDIFVK